MAIQPWAVLVCRFSDDADPANVLVRDLPGLTPAALADTGTVLELFQNFFTKRGANTFNAVRYFNEVSHGTIDLDGSQVFVVDMPYTKAQADALAINPGGAAYEAMITTAAQNAAIAQGVQLGGFYGIAITSQDRLDAAAVLLRVADRVSPKLRATILATALKQTAVVGSQFRREVAGEHPVGSNASTP